MGVMSRHPNLVRQAVAALADAGHAADVDIGGAHFKISWTENGRRHLLVVSNSPSDHRAHANCRATLQRLLRQGERSR
jgi:hypothetical protein